jgi:hypothetical protein
MSLSSNIVKFGSLALILTLLALIGVNGTGTQAQGAATPAATDASGSSSDSGGTSGSGTAGTAATAAATAESSATARCIPAEIAVYTQSPRVHVKCTSPTQGILYFAIGTQDAQNAQRVLTVLTTAITTGRALSIIYDPSDTSGQEIGCLPSNCRMIVAVSIVR